MADLPKAGETYRCSLCGLEIYVMKDCTPANGMVNEGRMSHCGWAMQKVEK